MKRPSTLYSCREMVIKEEQGLRCSFLCGIDAAALVAVEETEFKHYYA